MDNTESILCKDREDSLHNGDLFNTLTDMLECCVVLADKHGNIDSIHGDFAPYFISFDINCQEKQPTTDLVHRELHDPLQLLLRNAARDKKDTWSRTVTFDQGRQRVDIKVRHLSSGDQEQGYLITFIPAQSMRSISQTKSPAREDKLRDSEVPAHDSKSSFDDLQNTIEKLQASQNILQSALASMTDAVFICDSEGKLIDFNEAFISFHRFSGREICIKSLNDYFNTLDVYKENGEKATLEEWPVSLALEGRERTSAEYTIQRRDTGDTWVGSYSFAPILDDHGIIMGSVVSARDITHIKMAEEALIRSEKKYRELIETANSIIICWGRTGIIRFINSFGLRFFGYSAKELFGKHVTTILPKVENSSGRDLEALVKEIAKHPEKYSYVPNENITKNGDIVWVAWTNKAIRNDQGDLEEILAVGNDITALKQAEKALRDQQELLRGILNSITDAVIAVDMQGDITFINPTAESLSGWNNNRAKGKPVTEIFSILDEHTENPIEPISTNVLQKNHTVEIPAGSVMKARGGNTIYIEGNGSPLLGGEGETVGMLLTFQDVSEKRAQKQALLQSDNLLKKAGEIAHLGSWVFDINEKRFIWSDEEFRIFGLSPDQIDPTYESVYARLHPEDIQKINENYSNSLQNDTIPYDIEHRIIRPSGEVRHVHVKCEHIREKGKVVRSIGITHDITEYKKALMNLERSNRELEEFAYVASHDLQEPLRGITGFLQLLEQRYSEQLDDKGLEFIQHSVKAAHRMQSLIRELFNLSQLSSHPAAFVESDLSIILSEVIENLQNLVKEKKAIISTERLPRLQVDKNMTHSLFQNLLTNAIKYNNSDAPTVTIRCRETWNNYQISVVDNGIGIEPQFHERIFTIFQRLHTEREYSGTGMGLALCKKIIESHDGAIWVESTPGKGTTFHFTLPKNR